VLVSVQNQEVSPSSPTLSTGYCPVLYIGTGGKLRAEWWTNSVNPITSLNAVNDGTWHHAVLSTTISNGTTTQTLYLDGVVQGTLTGAVQLFQLLTGGNPTHLTFGAGYIGGLWPGETHNGSTGTWITSTVRSPKSRSANTARIRTLSDLTVREAIASTINRPKVPTVGEHGCEPVSNQTGIDIHPELTPVPTGAFSATRTTVDAGALWAVRGSPSTATAFSAWARRARVWRVLPGVTTLSSSQASPAGGR
jgi:Concanavalin A-like lectin/glucanases superfamily